MRVYFHLVRGREVIPDDEGITVGDASTVLWEAIEALREMKQSGDYDVSKWAGWTVSIVDEAGRFIDALAIEDGIQ